MHIFSIILLIMNGSIDFVLGTNWWNLCLFVAVLICILKISEPHILKHILLVRVHTKHYLYFFFLLHDLLLQIVDTLHEFLASFVLMTQLMFEIGLILSTYNE